MTDDLVNRLDVSGSATFDASGRAVVTFDSPGWQIDWIVTNIAVSTEGTGTVATTQDISYAYALNQQNVSNSSTPVDDQELAVALAANSVYEVLIAAVFFTSVNCDVKTAWSVPSGTAGIKMVTAATLAAAGFTAASQTEMRVDTFTLTGAVDYQQNAAGNGQSVIERAIIVTGATAGNLTFQWAQSAATIGNLTRNRYSFMRVTKVA